MSLQSELIKRESNLILSELRQAADLFYQNICVPNTKEDMRNVQRQAFTGMLWSKQYYNFNVQTWLDGDPDSPKPPIDRQHGRNSQWFHLDTVKFLPMNGRLAMSILPLMLGQLGEFTRSNRRNLGRAIDNSWNGYFKSSYSTLLGG